MKKLFSISICLCALVLASCEKASQLSVEPSSISLYTEGTKQLNVTPSKGVTYDSVDDFYASVSNTGLVTANKVGKTYIRVTSKSSSTSIPVTVMPKYTLYPEVESLVGQSVSKMTSVLGTNYKQGTTSSGETSYTYANYNTYAYGIVCTFKNGVCTSVGTIVSTTHLSKFCDYLIERYYVAGMQNDYYFFLDHDKKVVITMTLYNAYYMMAIYMPYTSSKAAADTESVAEVLRQIEF